ncbi:MAG: YicC family protein [Clostridiales bacterium]|nr:YicC family protein [Clostridiales bacterium]
MLRSMTGFGSGEAQDKEKYCNVELKSVNHRYMDISIKMPRFLTYLEEDIRKLIKEHIKRGRVEVYINYKNLEGKDVQVTTDIGLIEEYIKALDLIHDTFKIKKKLDVTTVANFPEVLKLENVEEDGEEIWDVLKEALNIALENLLHMRETEGNKLKEDLDKRLGILMALMKKIEERSTLIVAEYKERLTNRIKELLDDNIEIDESRLAMEIALFADKSNITEEIIRFYSHIEQFKASINNGDDAVGRKLDFIIQELNREINTIGSKSNDLITSNTVVEVKSELEKIREQIQNIE